MDFVIIIILSGAGGKLIRSYFYKLRGGVDQ